MQRFRSAAAAALLVAGGTFASAQSTPVPAAVRVTIDGSVPHPVTIEAAGLAALPHERVDTSDEDKTKAAYDGIAVHVLLEHAGVTFGEAIRGPRLLDYVVVTASDGYHAVFALPELDPAFADRKIILADRRNGAVLDAKHGPLQIVVPDESRHARWVRNVTSIAVEHAPPPEP